MLIAPPLKKPVSLPLKKPVSLPLKKPVSLPLKKPVSLPLKKPVSLPLKKPVPLPLNVPVPLPLNKPVSLPLNKPVSLPLNKLVSLPLNNPVSWPRKKRVYDRYCEICQVDYNSKIMEESHLKGKRHMKEMGQLENNAQGTISSRTSQVNKVKKHKKSQCKGPKPAKKKLRTSKQLADQQVI
ncbi:uncharacterized protein LOC127848585 isoform X1 [Dreissena polymorpha]|uniref:uncharacterized protein LOC127848585 isoform X1 n=1 Tax=Dreissena polymorpha TaxID=45954 RepID=UPI0022640330|nr:uncharacterized protein LOC127848585 isoform X1 [Dreissena polymorpha]